MYHTLFPDYLTLEEGRDRLEAQRLIEALRKVGLEALQTNVERATVLRRLGEEGVESVYHLLNLQRNEVAEWRNVGQVFLYVMDEMRAEVKRDPEAVLNRWHNELAELVFPEEKNAIEEKSSFCDLSKKNFENVHSFFCCNETMMCIGEVEQAFVEIIGVLERRWAHGGEVLRRYFLENLSVKTLVRVLGLSSSAALYRLVERRFLRPLLDGGQVYKLSLSRDFLQKMNILRKELLYRPVNVLEALQRMSPERFLFLMNMTLLSRTVSDRVWSCDFIVPRGEVQSTRRVLHALINELQLRPDFSTRKSIRMALGKDDRHPSFNGLLKHHPWIERLQHNYRLMSPQLMYDFCRIARILCDTPEALSAQEILMKYERRYLERPKRISLHWVSLRYPQVVALKRGVWHWQVATSKDLVST